MSSYVVKIFWGVKIFNTKKEVNEIDKSINKTKQFISVSLCTYDQKSFSKSR